MDDRERRNEIRVGEVGVELLDLRGEQKPLVDDRLRRAGADVGLRGRLLDLPADDVEPPLKHLVVPFVLYVLFVPSTHDEQLPDSRHHGAGIVTDGVGIDRDIAPRQHFTSFTLYDFFNLFFFAIPAEYHRDAERRVFVYCNFFVIFVFFVAKIFFDLLPEEPLWDLEQQSGAVAGFGIIAGGAAVQKALEDRHAVHDDLVGGFAGEVGHHAHTAVVMLEFRPVETLGIVFVFAFHGSGTSYINPSTVFPLARARTTSDAPEAQSPTQ